MAAPFPSRSSNCTCRHAFSPGSEIEAQPLAIAELDVGMVVGAHDREVLAFAVDSAAHSLLVMRFRGFIRVSREVHQPWRTAPGGHTGDTSCAMG